MRVGASPGHHGEQLYAAPFPRGGGAVQVLKNVSLTIREGGHRRRLGGGHVNVDEPPRLPRLNDLGQLSHRVAGLGTGGLDPDALAALGNVEIPAIYAGRPAEQRQMRAERLLARLGAADRTTRRPGQLFGGQQQRVSIARTLMNEAKVILADEPTGALDSRSGEEVLRILDELHAEGCTIIIVTHGMAVECAGQPIERDV